MGIQHRDPDGPVRRFLERARALASLCDRTGAALFVNGRVDVAKLVGAHLHLPAHAPAVQEIRPVLPDRWISAAVHDEAELARAAGADLVALSPVFPPGSKPGDRRTPLGLDGFDRLARAASMPAFALGGVTAARLRGLRSGRGAMVQSAVLTAPDARAAASELLAVLAASQPR